MALFDTLGELAPQAIRDLVDPAIPRIRGVVSDVFEDLQVRRTNDPFFSRMEEGELAWWMWTQIKHESENKFREDASLEYCRKNQQSYLLVGEFAMVVYKKLRRVRLPDGSTSLERSNYRTRQNFDLWSQRAINGFPDLPRLVFAYELLDELTSIKYYLGVPKAGQGDFRWREEILPGEIPVLGIRKEAEVSHEPADWDGFEIIVEDVESLRETN